MSDALDDRQTAILERLDETNGLLRELVVGSDRATEAANLATEKVDEANQANAAKIRVTRQGIAVLAVAVMVAGVIGWRYVDSRTMSCAERKTRAVYVVDGVVAGVESVARQYGEEPERRAEVAAQVQQDVSEAYPPPDC